MKCSLDSSVIDWVIEYPEVMKYMEAHGIDCSCGGKSLSYACRQREMDPHQVFANLLEMLQASASLHKQGEGLTS